MSGRRTTVGVAILCTGLLVAAISGLAGCGGKSADEQAVDKAKEAAITYVRASADGDIATVCSMETESALAEWSWPNESREEKVQDCESHPAIVRSIGREFGVEFPEAQKVELTGDTAKVEITGANDASAVVDLTSEDGHWRVSNEKTGG